MGEHRLGQTSYGMPCGAVSKGAAWLTKHTRTLKTCNVLLIHIPRSSVLVQCRQGATFPFSSGMLRSNEVRLRVQRGAHGASYIQPPTSVLSIPLAVPKLTPSARGVRSTCRQGRTFLLSCAQPSESMWRATKTFCQAGSCAASMRSCQEAFGGCRIMHPVGSKKLRRAMLTLSSLRR